MPVQIGERIFVAGGNKKFAALANDELVRYIGTDWSVIRIGLLVALNTNGVSNVTGRLGLGICSGQTNPLGHASSTTLFCGLRTVDSPGNWTYNAGAGNPYFVDGLFYGLRRVNTTNTQAGTGNTNQNMVANTGTLQRRSLIYVDYYKLLGSNNTVPFYNTTAQMGLDFTYEHFLEGLEYPNNPVVQNNTLFVGSTQSVNYDQTPGPLDNVDLHWSSAAQALEVYAWGVWRRS